MVSKLSCVIGIFLLVLVMAACQQNGQNAGQVSDPVDQSQRVIDSSAHLAHVTFVIVPEGIQQCADAGAGPVSAEISWRVMDQAVNEVRVEVADPGQESRKLLSLAGRQGSVKTDDWVVIGTRFYLSDSDTGQELARYSMPELPCN